MDESVLIDVILPNVMTGKSYACPSVNLLMFRAGKGNHVICRLIPSHVFSQGTRI